MCPQARLSAKSNFLFTVLDIHLPALTTVLGTGDTKAKVKKVMIIFKLWPKFMSDVAA